MKPFLKWAGGKRWLLSHPKIKNLRCSGRYIEPFLGGGAVFLGLHPKRAIVSDVNPRLIEAYQVVGEDPGWVVRRLNRYQKLHSKDFYYEERAKVYTLARYRAVQFIYLNRTCYNGLYRENLKGVFNVPIGTKTRVVFDDDDFHEAAKIIRRATILSSDFEKIIRRAGRGDLVFVDPPYTTAHNLNGFIKYNQNIFTWADQVRLRDSIECAVSAGARVVLTNASHESIVDLYGGLGVPEFVSRSSVISGKSAGRGQTSEALFTIGF